MSYFVFFLLSLSLWICKCFVLSFFNFHISGDPTLFGNFKPCQQIVDSMLETISTGKFNGYSPAAGRETARQAVADYCSNYGMDVCHKVGNISFALSLFFFFEDIQAIFAWKNVSVSVLKLVFAKCLLWLFYIVSVRYWIN